jgi:hypothetical protein
MRCVSVLETFQRNSCGCNSHPVGLGQPPEASLASRVVTVGGKRRQQVPKLCDRAPKAHNNVGAFVVCIAGATAARRIGLACPLRPGSKSRAEA